MAGTGSSVPADQRVRGRTITAPAVLTVVAAAVLAASATYGFSRATGWLSELVVLPVGAATLGLAVLLCVWAPRTFGLTLGRTLEHLVLVGSTLLAIAAVVLTFRMTGSAAPYDATVGEFLLVPLGEELLFRGVLLAALVELFRVGNVPHHIGWAVAVSALAFGMGHLGNLGYTETAFVVLQVFVATAFGVAAGWVRMRTDSIVGPVLMHMTMNVVAVV